MTHETPRLRRNAVGLTGAVIMSAAIMGAGGLDCIVLVLALIIVGHGGQDGASLHPLSPSASPNGFNGLTTGFVFAALMVALPAGQIIEQTTKPYTWFPWVIVLWVALFASSDSEAPARRPVAAG